MTFKTLHKHSYYNLQSASLWQLLFYMSFLTLLQKKPKIMGKDHSMSEVSKHSTSTETMFFEKVSIILFSTHNIFKVLLIRKMTDYDYLNVIMTMK